MARLAPVSMRCASTSNRNFVGRQGKGARTHLVSPAMATAACHGWQTDRCPAILDEVVMEPFARLEATAVPIGIPNLDTDQIIPARFLWRKRSEGWGHLLFNGLAGQKDTLFGLPMEPLTGSMCEPAPRSNPGSNIPPPRDPAIARPKSSPRVMDDKNQIGNRGMDQAE